jgi:hypothetical protein
MCNGGKHKRPAPLTRRRLLSANSGSLLVRSLGDVVKPSMFVLDSEYLVTLCVIVPKCVSVHACVRVCVD